MIITTVIDDRSGLMFHNRRQSQDRVLRQKIRQLAEGKKLWMNAYSGRLFASDESNAVQIVIAEDFLMQAAEGDFCFVENLPVAPCADCIEKVILFRWNRRYPADIWLDLDLSGWILESREEFAGSSHPKITMEIYNNPGTDKGA